MVPTRADSPVLEYWYGILFCTSDCAHPFLGAPPNIGELAGGELTLAQVRFSCERHEKKNSVESNSSSPVRASDRKKRFYFLSRDF